MEDDTGKEPIKDNNIIRSGRLDVGDGHKIYWVDWGNKDVENPIFYLHGGPGGGFQAGDFSRFNPKKHRIIFHDQRGSSRSTPFASIENNTSQNLVSDIEKLRVKLGFKKISLYGFSWGSTLSLLYAIEYPEVVERMLIGGIYLARDEDNDFYLRGKVESHFPEVWGEFESIVPTEKRGDIAGYYREMMLGDDKKAREKFVKAWAMYESSLVRLDYVPETVEGDLKDFSFESLAVLEAHYILNNCFIEEDYIIKNAKKLKDIKIVIVHGRYDFVCMPKAALKLHKALDEKSILHFVTGGHVRGELGMREVIKAYTNMLW